MDYTIVGFQNHNIMLEFDGRRVNFVLPIGDNGLYPVGAELDTLLATYVANARAASSAQAVVPANAADIAALVVVTPAVATDAAVVVRRQRNRLLARTDMTQLVDANQANAGAWAGYRQALRDITAQPGFPTVTWPVPPAVITAMDGKALTDAAGVPVV